MWLVIALGCPSASGPSAPPPPPTRQAYRTWTGSAELDRAGRALAVSPTDDRPIFVGAPTGDWDHNHGPFPGGAYRLDPTTPAGALDDVAPVHYVMTEQGAGSVVFAGDVGGPAGADVAAVLPGDPPAPTPIVRVHAAALDGDVLTGDAWANITITTDGDGGPSEICGCDDVTGDGRADLSFGATGGIDSVADRVGIVVGPLSPGDHPFDLVDVVMTAPLDEQAGRHLGCGRDLDGDGTNDLLVGADEALDGDGKLYLVSAPQTGVHELSVYPAWTGEPGGGQAGQALAMGGDIDGDGLDDAVVGAPQLVYTRGRVYVLTDKDGGEIADSWLTFDGVGALNMTGLDSAAGDVDGDGTQDLLVGVPRNIYFGFDRPGQVAVFLGPLGPGRRSTADADLLLVGSDEPDAFGFALDVADIDHDGVDDVVVGAPYDSRYAEEAGAVHLFRGGVDVP